jgi:pilus assembly protein CpaB
MRRPGNILLLAVLIGALCAALAYRYFRQLRLELEAARGSANRPVVEIAVASQPISIGSRIEESQVKMISWPVEAQPDGAFRDPKLVVGGVAVASLEKNEPILQSQVVAQGAGLLPLMITDGMRGMSVKVDDVTGVSGFITPNSRVDLLIAGTPEGSQEQRSKVVLQNIRVLAIGKLIEQRDNKPVEVPTVTLLVSPEDAERLTLATTYQPLRLALRSYRDEEIVHTGGILSRSLFEGDGVRPPAVGKVPAPRRGGAPYSVEILLGEKLTRQPLF